MIGLNQVKALALSALLAVAATASTGCDPAVEVTPGTAVYELDIYNNSSMDVWVYIDGSLETFASPGELHAYALTAGGLDGFGRHHIVLEEAFTGSIILDEYQVVSANIPLAYTIDDENLLPVIAIENDNPGCVAAQVDGVWVDSYLSDNPQATGAEDVCYGETGYFSVAPGTHTIDVYEYDDLLKIVGRWIDSATDTFYLGTLTTIFE